MAAAVGTVEQLDAEVSVCRACPRLVEWREEVAVVKRKSFADRAVLGPARFRVGVRRGRG